MTDSAKRHSRMTTRVVFGVALLVYVLMYFATLRTLIEVWAGDGTFQYAFLIIPISLFLAWSRRQEVASCEFSPSLVGVLLIVALASLWLVGDLVGVMLVQHFAVVALLPALVLAVYGASVGRVLLFPLLYLFFAYPWPVAGLTTLLQHITAVFSVRVLQLTGFTTVLQGVVIETPFGAWHVAEACSGIKFFIASLALGALYAHLFYRSWRRRLVFMVFAFVMPIIANGFRVYFTVVIGEVFGVQYATGTDHLIFGWQFFGTVLLLLFVVGWHWRELDPRQSTAEVRVDPGPPSGRIVSFGALAVLLLLSGPLAAWGLAAVTPAMPSPSASAVPQVFGAWRLMLPEANPLGARYRAPDAEFMGTFADGTRHVNVVRIRYDGRPRDGHKLFLTGNRPFDTGQWRQIGKAKLLRGAGFHEVHQLRLSSGGQRRLVWYWYEVGGHVVQGLVEVKFRQLFDGLRAAPLSTAVMLVSTPLPSSARNPVEDAAQSLRLFVQAYAAAEQGR